MKFTPWIPIACFVLLLSGCSRTQEDVRITFCKNLTAELLKPEKRIDWQDSEQQLAGYEPAAITVHLATSDQAGQSRNMQATCFYPYNTVDENAMTHSHPLSAYATVPEKMTLNGRSVAEIKLREAILVVQLATGRATVNQIRQGIDAGVERLQSAIDEDSER